MNKRLIKSNDEGGGLSFNTVLYDGNSTTNSITGVGFQPDFVWIKNRNGVPFANESHVLNDVVRGAGNSLFTNLTDTENFNATTFLSFNTDGFTLGSDAYTAINRSGGTYVAWCWKAGGAAVTNTDGTITSQVSANTEAGFSIVSWNGIGPGQSIGHGLNAVPSMIIHKRRTVGDWEVYTSTTGANQKLVLNSTAASVSSTAFGNTTPTSDVYYAGGYFDPMIAYCFAEVAGFSKFGSHTTNAKITTDFEPAWVMIKYTGVANNWWIMDLARWDGVSYGANGGKLIKPYLMANSSSQELSVPNGSIEVMSDGFYPTNYFNAAGAIHMAFANQF